MALNPAAVATDVSDIIVAALKAAVKQHEIELAHPGRALDTAAYPPSKCAAEAKIIVDLIKPGLAGHLSPMVPADAADEVSNMIGAGIQAAVTQYEIELAHPGRAVPTLLYPPSNAALAGVAQADVIKPTLVTNFTVLNPALAAENICDMVVAGCRYGFCRYEVDLAHPGRGATTLPGDIGANIAAAVTPVVTALKAQLITDLT